MERLEDIAADIEAVLDEKDAVREVALKSSRSVVRICGKAIRDMHKGRDTTDLILEAREELHNLLGITSTFLDIQYAGFVETAMQEYVEAMVLDAIMKRGEIPSPGGLGVTPEAYLMGVGDVIGEIRRQTLDSIKEGDIGEAVRLLEIMDALYEFIIRFNYPNALVAIKRKQDIARGVIEKTRGEVAVAVRTRTLEEKLKGA